MKFSLEIDFLKGIIILPMVRKVLTYSLSLDIAYSTFVRNLDGN